MTIKDSTSQDDNERYSLSIVMSATGGICIVGIVWFYTVPSFHYAAFRMTGEEVCSIQDDSVYVQSVSRFSFYALKSERSVFL